MARLQLSPRAALWLFILITTTLIAQAAWWITFMARLTDEKVDLAIDLGADPEFVARLHDEEISRQIMLGTEGVFFLLLVVVGAWVIYRSLVNAERLKFNQQNFLMAVTHELKTPLASMKIYLDSLKSDKVTAERKKSIVPRLDADVHRLEKLVENVLEAGRFERGGYKLHLSTFQIDGLLHEAIERVKRYPASRAVEVDSRIADGLMFTGDRAALQRAVDAILENSIKYNDKDAVRISVDASVEPRGRIVIRISDNGIGLSDQNLQRIFDRFYRAGEELTRSQPGSGLGLFLCREIVRSHGGSVTADSDGIGKGTTFTIRLPEGGLKQ